MTLKALWENCQNEASPFHLRHSAMESALELIFSPSAASVILFMTALKCGTNSYRKVITKANTNEKILNHLSKLKSEQNWGKLSFHDIDFEKGSENHSSEFI